jgi:signal transduction histidine kinase
MANEVLFPTAWVDSLRFERSLSRSEDPHRTIEGVLFRFPHDCKIMVDAGIRLLCLANQLQDVGKIVTLVFDDGVSGTQGYLDRMGFFDLLHPDIRVAPNRPSTSTATVYRGANPSLVEFRAINPCQRDKTLPSCLEEALVTAVSHRPDHRALGNMAFTVFSELVDNIYEHSATHLEGYAGLQVYHRGGRVKVVVSDSGKGIIETLRPALLTQYRRFANRSDSDLVVEAFRTGLSRHGTGRGCGLKACADHAIRFGANLEVRLPTCYVRLVPSSDGYRPNTAYMYQHLPLIWGTHITFDFHLDK